MPRPTPTAAVLALTLTAAGGCGPSAEQPVRSGEAPRSPVPTLIAGALPLEISADPGGIPSWTVTERAGWKSAVQDKQGYNQLANHTNGCMLTTYQSLLDITAPDDKTASRKIVRIYLRKIGAKATSEHSLGTTTIRVRRTAASQGSGDIEFAAGAIGYTGADGMDRESIVAARALTRTDRGLVLVLACPATTMPHSRRAVAMMTGLAKITVE